MKNNLLILIASLVVISGLTFPVFLSNLSDTILGKFLMVILIIIYANENTVCGLLFALFIFYIFQVKHVEGFSQLEEIKNNIIENNQYGIVNEKIFNNKYLCEQMRKPDKSKKLPRFSYEDIDIKNNISEIKNLYIV